MKQAIKSIPLINLLLEIFKNTCVVDSVCTITQNLSLLLLFVFNYTIHIFVYCAINFVKFSSFSVQHICMHKRCARALVFSQDYNGMIYYYYSVQNKKRYSIFFNLCVDQITIINHIKLLTITIF